MITIAELQHVLGTLRAKKPLVLSLTNVVTMDFMANGLLALGAIPLMSQDIAEASELLAISQALNINIGTTNEAFNERAIQTAMLAKNAGLPVVLDPVGAGASRLRTDIAQNLMPYATIIRGNSSEIVALAGEINTTRGVEASIAVADAIDTANTLALDKRVVVISGVNDYITDGRNSCYLPFGSPLMALVTGMGCTLTAVIAAFVGSGFNTYHAALYATAYFGLCGQVAAQQAMAPGSFRQCFIDQLYNPDWQQFTYIAEHLAVVGEAK